MSDETIEQMVEKFNSLGKLQRWVDHLQHCRSALEDIYQQVGGKCPDGVEPMTWLSVYRLVNGDDMA